MKPSEYIIEQFIKKMTEQKSIVEEKVRSGEETFLSLGNGMMLHLILKFLDAQYKDGFVVPKEENAEV